MFERFAERVRKALWGVLDAAVKRARKAAAITLTATVHNVHVVVVILRPEELVSKEGGSRFVHRTNKRSMRHPPRSWRRAHKRFIKRWGPVTVSIILPAMVSSLAILSEILKLVGTQ